MLIKSLENEELENVKRILEEDAKTECFIRHNNMSVFISSDYNELYLKQTIYPEKGLVISRIEIANQRIGTGTKLLKELILLSEQKGFGAIIAESVLSKGMIEFCKKHGFTPDPTCSFETPGGIILGNWILNLNEKRDH